MAKLVDSKETIAVLQKTNFQFKKQFGQNFLIDSSVLDHIISHAKIQKEDLVIEIGPGIDFYFRGEPCRKRKFPPPASGCFEGGLYGASKGVSQLLFRQSSGKSSLLHHYPHLNVLTGKEASFKIHHRYGTKGGGGENAGRPRYQGLRRFIPCGAILQ